MKQFTKNNIVIGPYNVDLFVTEDGKLGITCDRNDGKSVWLHTLDVIIPTDLNPENVVAG